MRPHLHLRALLLLLLGSLGSHSLLESQGITLSPRALPHHPGIACMHSDSFAHIGLTQIMPASETGAG